jgi:hypothetical protein
MDFPKHYVIPHPLIFLKPEKLMPQPDPIHFNYVKEFTKLSLWYVHKRFREGETDFEGTVNSRVNIYRNTTLYDGKRHPSSGDVGQVWADLLSQLKAIFDQHFDDPSTAQLEENGLNLLLPYLRKRRDPMPSPESRPYECWTYNYSEDRVHIHIFNVYQPKSPLSEMHSHFAASLIRLLKNVQLKRPDIEVVSCGSWLNSASPFLALFPQSWKASAEPRPEVRYTMGHWGQFADRRGDFHARNGAFLRETGDFRFPNLSCQAPIAEVLGHLEERFSGAVAYNGNRSAQLERVLVESRSISKPSERN